MDCFINENDNVFDDSSSGKHFSTGHQDDISMFFEETIFNFKSPVEP